MAYTSLTDPAPFSKVAVTWATLIRTNFDDHETRILANAASAATANAKGFVNQFAATSNSGAWNSATEVLTNLVLSFTAVAARRYRVKCSFNMTAGSTAVTAGFRIRANNSGSVNSSSSLVIAHPARGDTGTATYRFFLEGDFVAGSSGTYTVGLFGCNPSGDPSSCFLYGSSSTSGNGLSTNTITVDCVAA